MLAPLRGTESLASHLCYGRPLKWLPVFCLVVLATRERVDIFFQAYLIRCKIFFQLIPYVFCYHPFVLSYGIYKISSTPKVPIPILVFEICVPIENHQRTFALEETHELCYTKIRWNTHWHMYMIRACFCFDYFHLFSLGIVFAVFPLYLPLSPHILFFSYIWVQKLCDTHTGSLSATVVLPHFSSPKTSLFF